MSTTTIRLPDTLKDRVAHVAAHCNQTTHSFILEAIAEKTEREERRQQLEETADRRYAKILTSGDTIAWDEMRNYLEAKLAGQQPNLPQARKLAR